MAFLAFTCALCILYFYRVWRENQKKDRIMASGDPSYLEEDEEVLGDLATKFRYSY